MTPDRELHLGIILTIMPPLTAGRQPDGMVDWRGIYSIGRSVQMKIETPLLAILVRSVVSSGSAAVPAETDAPAEERL
jgi:hypothetical protein